MIFENLDGISAHRNKQIAAATVTVDHRNLPMPRSAGAFGAFQGQVRSAIAERQESDASGTIKHRAAGGETIVFESLDNASSWITAVNRDLVKHDNAADRTHDEWRALLNPHTSAPTAATEAAIRAFDLTERYAHHLASTSNPS